MFRRLVPLVSLVATAVLAGACGSPDDEVDSATGASSTTGDEDSLFGDDRVGDKLAKDTKRIPQGYAAYETTFDVGRKCVRPDGKGHEIYIVEEAQTRGVEGGGPGGANANGSILPRAVVTGCNTAADTSVRTLSYELMTALVSNPTGTADNMALSPLEVMALDRTTGLYNFYVFRKSEKDGALGSVTRFFRDKNGKVFRRTFEGGDTAPGPVTANTENNACFRCHVNGAPLMNELVEPWSNWVSPNKVLKSDTMKGTTKELVDLASGADQLEQIIRDGTVDFVGGGGVAGRGWLNRTRDGKLKGAGPESGLAEVIKPLFCQTELNYKSRSNVNGTPLQVFFDPAVTASAELQLPSSASDPFLFPIRSARDEAVEATLKKRGYIADGVAAAVRLLDDENDIFSAKRCGVFADAKKAVTAALATVSDKTVEAEVARVVREALKGVIDTAVGKLITDPARLAYAKSRLAGTTIEKTKPAYNAELAERLGKMSKDIGARSAARRDLAIKMLPGNASNSPRPILDKPKAAP